MNTSLTKAYCVRAMCNISLGSKCSVVDMSNDHERSYKQCLELEGQEAVVVGLNEVTVDIRIETGPRKGVVVPGIRPVFLFFDGIFQRVELVEEAHF